MKQIAVMAILAVAVACADNDLLNPSVEAPENISVATVHPMVPANGGWSFTAVATPIAGGDPGSFRITPGGIIHWTGLTNVYELSGDLAGTWYWTGKANYDGNKGPAIGESMLMDLTDPDAGTFDCRGTGVGVDYGTPSWKLDGPQVACAGSGAFEGMHMMSYAVNRIGTAVFDITGVIW